MSNFALEAAIMEGTAQPVTLARFRVLAKKELVRRGKVKKAKGRAAYKARVARAKKAKPLPEEKVTPAAKITPVAKPKRKTKPKKKAAPRRKRIRKNPRRPPSAPPMETPAEDGSIFWKEAAPLCGVSIPILNSWVFGSATRPSKIASKKVRRLFRGRNRDLVFVQLTDVETLCKLQNVGNFRVEGHTIDGVLFLYAWAAAEKTGYDAQYVRKLGRLGFIDVIELPNVHSMTKLYSWPDLEMNKRVGRRKL